MKGLTILLDNLGNSLVQFTFRLFENGALCNVKTSFSCENITTKCLPFTCTTSSGVACIQ